MTAPRALIALVTPPTFAAEVVLLSPEVTAELRRRYYEACLLREDRAIEAAHVHPFSHFVNSIITDGLMAEAPGVDRPAGIPRADKPVAYSESEF